jgi:alpha-tubulin suppressor-like RCC1 family protein
VKSISAYLYSAMALLTNGTVKDWGQAPNGNDTGGGQYVPAKVSNLTGVTAISEGGLNAMALLSNGTVMGWGQDSEEVLGKIPPNPYVPIKIVGLSGVKSISDGDNFALALLTNGTVEAWGDNSQGELANGTSNVPTMRSTPKVINGLSSIKNISASGQDDFAVVSR